MKELQNKNIFITGSSSGIGFGVAKKFFDSGSNVVINSKNLSKLKLASKKLNDCDYFQSDLTKKNSIISMFKKMKKEKKTIDVLICNYGNSNFDKNNLDFEHAFNANFFSTINTINYALPLLNKKSAKIICISSICGVEVIKNAPIGYSIAKSALNNYVKSISFVLGSKNIKINTILIKATYSTKLHSIVIPVPMQPDSNRFTNNEVLRDEAPEPRVTAMRPVISHYKVMAFWDCNFR